MSEAEVKKQLSLFFYLSLTQNTLAKKAAKKTYPLIRSSSDAGIGHFVECSCYVGSPFFEKNISNEKYNYLQFWPSEKVSSGPWIDYLKTSRAEEVFVLIWAQVLKIPLADIAQGLKVSKGVVKHRLNTGLRKFSLALVRANG